MSAQHQSACSQLDRIAVSSSRRDKQGFCAALLRRQNYSFALESTSERDFFAQRQARKSRRVSFESPIFS